MAHDKLSFSPHAYAGVFTALLTICALNTSASGNTVNGNTLTKTERQVIDKAIRRLRVYDPLTPGGNFLEVETERIHVFGSLENRPSVAVQFTMEGGNAEYFYLVVLDRMSNTTTRPIRIGGRGYRHIAIHHMDSDKIYACAMFYGPEDTMPQPTVAGTVSFRLFNNEIVESSTVVNDDAPIRGCKTKP